MLARLFVVALLLVAALPSAMAAPPASPSSLPGGVARYVYAEFDFEQPTISTLALDAGLWIYRYEVDGQTFDADELQAAMQGPGGAAFIASFEAAVADALTDSLREAFPGASVTGVDATLDQTSLQTPGGNALDPPVHVTATASVARDRETMGLDGYSDAAVAAALQAGGRVATAFDLPAQRGYQIVYTIQAPASPAGLRFAQGPDVNGAGTAVFATVDNTNGNEPSRAIVATLVDPGARPPTAESITSAVIVDLGAADDEKGGIPVDITVTSEISAIDVEKRMPGMLPPLIAMDFVDANGLRALRQSGAIKDADLSKANQALLNAVRVQVQKTFGPDVVVSGGLSTEDLARPASAEPITFTADATTVHKMTGAKASELALALQIGGTAELDLDFFAVFGRATSFLVHAPPDTRFLDAANGDITTNGATATFDVPDGAKDWPAGFLLHGEGVPDFSAQLASVNVTVDLEDLDVSLGQAAGGDFGDLLVQITVAGELRVIEVPAELRASVPPALGIDHLSSDGVRLLVESGRITEQDLANLEARLVANVAEKLGAALGGEIPVAGGLDRATLALDLVSDPVSAEKPLKFKATARVVKPLDGGPVQPQSAAIALYTQVLPLTLPKIEGIDTTYTIIMPRGLSVQGVEGAQSVISRSADGREQFTVSPQGDSASVDVSMAVTPAFVMVKFWPAVLLAVILIVLIVGTPVALVVRKRGKAKKAAAAPKK